MKSIYSDRIRVILREAEAFCPNDPYCTDDGKYWPDGGEPTNETCSHCEGLNCDAKAHKAIEELICGEVDGLKSRIKELEEALKPFAVRQRHLDRCIRSDGDWICASGCRAEDSNVERACRVLGR